MHPSGLSDVSACNETKRLEMELYAAKGEINRLQNENAELQGQVKAYQHCLNMMIGKEV